MPFTTEELNTWVGGLGLPEESKKAVLAALGAEQILPKVGETLMLRPEFSRKLDELQKEKDRLEADYQAKKAQEDQFHNSVAEWKTQKERDAEAAITKARQDAEGQLNTARAKVRELATRHGIPEEDIKDLVSAPTNQNPETRRDQPREDDGRYMSIEQFKKEAEFFARMPGIQLSLDREYYRLFGQDAPPVNWEKVIQDAKGLAKTSQQPLTDAFNSLYKIPEKRAEIAAAAHKKEIEDAEKRGEEAARSKMLAEHPEVSVRSVNRPHQGSPILDRGREQQKQFEKDGKLPPPNTGSRDTINAAVAAFNEGRYSAEKRT